MELDDELRWQTWNPLAMSERLANLGAQLTLTYPAMADATECQRARWYGQLEAFELLLYGERQATDAIAVPATGAVFDRADTPRRAGMVVGVMAEHTEAAALVKYGDLVTVTDRDTLVERNGEVLGLCLGWDQASYPAKTFAPYVVVRFGGGVVEAVPLSRTEPLPALGG
jgi:hypothetical protein